MGMKVKEGFCDKLSPYSSPWEKKKNNLDRKILKRTFFKNVIGMANCSSL